MSIGIFGDSFATFTNDFTDKRTPSAWFNILAKKLGRDRTLYGEPGTSIYHSYKIFLNHYTKHDNIVFILSDPFRYPKSLRFEFDDFVNEHTITSMERLEYLRRTAKLTANDGKTCNYLEGYFRMADEDYSREMAELMVMHMSSLHSNVIFYPAFPTYTKTEVSKEYTLFKLLLKQQKHFGLTEDDFYQYTETSKMVAHLVEEYNQAFAEVLFSKFKTGKFDFSYFDNVQIKGRLSDYYVKRNS